MKLFSLLLSLLVFPLSAPAQEGRVSERVDVVVVEIPVTVADRAGNPVRNLTAANFELIDDGKKRKIEYFDVIDLAPATDPRTSRAEAPAHRRNFLLLFDLGNSTPADLVRATDAAKQFVASQLKENDLVSVGTLSAERGFQLLTGFTTDRAAALSAISTLGHPRFFVANDPLLLSADVRTGAASGQSQASDRGEAMQQHYEDLSRGSARGNEEIERRKVLQQVASLSALATMLDRVPGQKQVLLMSSGFDSKLIHGRETLSSEESQEDAAASVHGEIWKVDSDRRYGSSSATTVLADMGSVFKRSDVVLHALDIKGLRSNVDAREGTKASSNEALHLLTQSTGGTVFKNSNNIDEHFGAMLRRQEVVYVLGFTAPVSRSGKFRDVKVRLVNVPGGARASHRPGYYDRSSVVSPMEKVLVASDLLMRGAPAGDIRLRSVTAAFPRPARAEAPIVLEIDGKPLLDAAGSEAVANLELFIYAFDEQSRVADFAHQAVTLDLLKTAATLAKAGLRYYGTLDLPPGKYEIRTLITTSTGRYGLSTAPLVVSGPGEQALLPPFLFSEPGEWIMVKAAGGEAGAYPFTIGAESFIPAATPRLAANGKYRLALFAYNVPAEALQLTARVRSATGGEFPAKIALVGRAPSDATSATKLLFSFEPGALPPGEYKLEFTVKGKAAAPALASAVSFTI